MSMADIKEGIDVNVFSGDKNMLRGEFRLPFGLRVTKKMGQGSKDLPTVWSKGGGVYVVGEVIKGGGGGML